MLIHITPRIYIPHLVHGCELTRLQVPELGIDLTDEDLATRKPYPNKRLSVACRRSPRKAIQGILIETADRVQAYTSIATWEVAISPTNQLQLSHITHYQLLDHQHDAASDNMLLWYAGGPLDSPWERRWPQWADNLTPAAVQPRMELLGQNHGGLPAAPGVLDRLDAHGHVMERTTHFAMHTIERARLRKDPFSERLPAPQDAFTAQTSVGTP